MTPRQTRQVAARCAELDPRWEALILIQGICGLRPGEAIALRGRDVASADGQPTEITARATHSSLPERYFAGDESRRRPLKGRGEKVVRLLPVPLPVSEALQRHPTACAQRRSSTLLFASSTGKRLHLSNFHRDVWKPVRQALFDADDPLRRVRMHDLRHAAITTWLNAGVP